MLDQSNLKDFAHDEMNVTYLLNFVLGREENIVGKGENAGYQHFFPFFPQCFKRPLCQGCLKSGLSGKELKKKKHCEKRRKSR